MKKYHFIRMSITEGYYHLMIVREEDEYTYFIEKSINHGKHVTMKDKTYFTKTYYYIEVIAEGDSIEEAEEQGIIEML